MKTKPLKALEPGIKKNRSIHLVDQIMIISVMFVLGVALGTIFGYIVRQPRIRQQSATIARQQLIIDTLKGDTTSYIVDHSEIKRDQEGD